MKSPLLLLIFMISSTFVFSQTQKQKAKKYLIERGELVFTFTANNLEEINKLASMISFDHGQDPSNPLTINAIANEREFQKFLNFNLTYVVDTEKNEPKEVQMYQAPLQGVNARAYTLAFPLSAYPTYAQYAQQMADFAADHPTICELVDIGGTVQGDKRLLFIKLSDNVSTREQEPRVMYTSSMHGDEIAGFPSMLNLIDYFITAYNDTGHSDHSRIKNLLDNSEVWINPLANPDATYWLDNSNESVANSRRQNANNVDLNRNYPDNVSGAHPDGEVYQIETLNFMTLAENYHFVLSANFHGGTEVINYPWDNTSVRHPDDDWYFLISKEYAVNCQNDGPSGYMDEMYTDYVWPGVTNGSDWYTVFGGRQDYMNYQHHAKELTIELSNVKTPPGTNTGADNEIIDIWNYNQDAYIDYLLQGTYGFQGVVKDVNTGNPIKAKITLVGHDNTGSWVETELPLGDYYRSINAGTYDVLFEADCYNSYTLSNQTIADYQTIVLADVYLTPKTPAYPYVENFDAGIGEWKQDPSDDGDWTLNSFGTASSTTGPSDDFNAGGQYFYTEASDGSNPGYNATVNLISPCINFTGYSNASFSFYYHMFGLDMGGLLLDVSDDMETTWTNLVTINGGQQTANNDPWLIQNVDLSAYDGQSIKLRFSGQTGGGFRSDMAIDNITLTADEDAVLSTSSFEINKWSIYPNPANEVLFINTPNDVTLLDYKIINILGKTVIGNEFSSGNNKIDVSSLNTGMYFLSLTTDNENISQKIIIE